MFTNSQVLVLTGNFFSVLKWPGTIPKAGLMQQLTAPLLQLNLRGTELLLELELGRLGLLAGIGYLSTGDE